MGLDITQLALVVLSEFVPVDTRQVAPPEGKKIDGPAGSRVGKYFRIPRGAVVAEPVEVVVVAVTFNLGRRSNFSVITHLPRLRNVRRV